MLGYEKEYDAFGAVLKEIVGADPASRRQIKPKKSNFIIKLGKEKVISFFLDEKLLARFLYRNAK